MTTLIVGVGAMAQQYAPVLLDMGEDVIALGRDSEKAKKFELATGIRTVVGTLETVVRDYDITKAIVVVPVLALEEVSLILMKSGVQDILIEKPGALNTKGLYRLKRTSQQKNVRVNIAYNRRFFASTLKAKQLIQEDGGAQLVTFNFTEMTGRIESLNYPLQLTENWFFGNSTHVADTAIFLGGCPVDVHTFKTGSFDWHSKGATFSGSAITHTKTLYSFSADWAGSGRWSLEVSTAKQRLILCPLETLRIQASGQFGIVDADFDVTMDQKYKPGLYRMVEAFLCKGEYQDCLCPLQEHIQNVEAFYDKICLTT